MSSEQSANGRASRTTTKDSALEHRTWWYLDGHLTRPGRHRDLELRAEASRIVGWAVLFNVRSRELPGGFVEIVKPEACAGVADADVVALYNHDAGAVLGRTPKTLQLRSDDRGLAFELSPANTTAGRDAYELVKRGDVTGCSFGFRTRKDHWRKDGDVHVRELLDIELAEISLTAFPCYVETDVSIAQRSLQAATRSVHSTQSIAWLRLKSRHKLT